MLASDARQGLLMVAEGEDKVIEGWLLYGVALNAGRKLFPKGDNTRFNEWIATANLAEAVHDHDRVAAMWAAELSPGSFHVLRRLHPKVRTVRGLHAKWNEARKPQPEAPKEVPTEDELRVVQKLPHWDIRGA